MNTQNSPSTLPRAAGVPVESRGVESRVNSLPEIVSFSGGQTSGYMLWRLKEQHPDFLDRFTVIFENTGKEHNATLDFVHEVETQWGIPVVWLEYTRVPAAEINPLWVPKGRKRSNLIRQQERGEGAHWFKIVSYETAARETDARTPFDELLEWATVLPNVRTRMCSVQLKVRTRDRYLRSLGIGAFKAYIGIRKDEEHRKFEILVNVDKYEQPQFPLCDENVTHAHVDTFWDAHPFKLNIANYDGNCRLCYLKARWKRLKIVRDDPQSGVWWDQWEKRKAADGITGDGRFFKRGESYAGLIAESKIEQFDFKMDGEDVPCSCAVGGYRHSKTDEPEDEQRS